MYNYVYDICIYNHIYIYISFKYLYMYVYIYIYVSFRSACWLVMECIMDITQQLDGEVSAAWR